jgi:hypothetical protein
MKSSVLIWYWLALGLIVLVLAGGCWDRSTDKPVSFNRQFESLVKPYTFNVAAWEFKTLSRQLLQAGKKVSATGESEAATAVNFFSVSTSDQDPVLKEKVEAILAHQITRVLAEQGIYNPFAGLHLTFPPVNFKLENPPHLLVVSPRDRIERMRDVTLKQEIRLDQIEKLESGIEQLNVSALVTPIGGLGATYPSFVMDNSDLKYTIDTAAEEWLHQYLAFKPLGFYYVLDLLRIRPDADIDTINETVAGIASEEIGDLVYARYYSRYPLKQPQPSDPAAFDFNAAMRETRLAVDAYLVSGQIEQAERYMEARRQFINSHGYNIRKLNQAYFAFYGSYAYSPDSIDVLGNQIKTLRQQSSSLQEFLRTASQLTSRQALIDILGSEK